MSLIFAPQGFKLDKQGVGMARQEQFDNIFPDAFSPFNFYRGMPVKKTNAGTIEPVTSSDDIIFGIFNGMEYVDGNSQRPVNQSYYLANSPILANAYLAWNTQTKVRVYLYTMPQMIYQLQFTGSLAASPVGQQFNLDDTTTTVVNPDGSTFPAPGVVIPLLQNGTAPYGGYSYAALDPTPVLPEFTGQVVVQALESIIQPGGNSFNVGFPTVRALINRQAMFASVTQPDYPAPTA